MFWKNIIFFKMFNILEQINKNINKYLNQFLILKKFQYFKILVIISKNC